MYFSNDLTFPFLPHTACTFFLPPSTKISCSTLLFHIRTSLLIKYSGTVTVLIFLYSSLYLELLILSYRSYLCNLFQPLSVCLFYGAMSLPLSSVCPLWSYRLSERILLSSSHFNFLFFPFLISAVQPSNNFFSIFLFFLHISMLCSLPLFHFCSILWSFTVYVDVHLSSSVYLPVCFPFFLALFILIIPMLRITDQYIIILVLKCLSDSFFPVPNTFATASLLHCSSSLQHNTLCTLLFLLYSPLPSFTLSPSLTSFPCLQSEYLISLCSVATSSLSASSPISFQFFFCPHHQHNIICICQHMHFNLPIIIPSFCIPARFCTKSAVYRANSEGLNG